MVSDHWICMALHTSTMHREAACHTAGSCHQSGLRGAAINLDHDLLQPFWLALGTFWLALGTCLGSAELAHAWRALAPSAALRSAGTLRVFGVLVTNIPNTDSRDTLRNLSLFTQKASKREIAHRFQIQHLRSNTYRA